MHSDSGRTNDAWQSLNDRSGPLEVGVGATAAVMTYVLGDVSKVKAALVTIVGDESQLIALTDRLIIVATEPADLDGSKATANAWPWSSVVSFSIAPMLDSFQHNGPLADPGALDWHPACTLTMSDGTSVQFGHDVKDESGYQQRQASDEAVECLIAEVLRHL